MSNVNEELDELVSNNPEIERWGWEDAALNFEGGYRISTDGLNVWSANSTMHLEAETPDKILELARRGVRAIVDADDANE